MKRRKQTAVEALRRVAESYREMGYTIVLEPGPQDLPAFLHGMHLDAIAHKDQEHVAIEVKSPSSLQWNEDLVRLANAVKSEPGWRFDLIAQPLLGDLRDQEYYRRKYDVIPVADIERHLETSRRLASQKDFDAALIIAWTALEATLRRLALQNDVSLATQSRPHLLKALASQGVITRMDYQALERSLDVRNRIAHGHVAEIDLARLLPSVLKRAERLLKDELLNRRPEHAVTQL